MEQREEELRRREEALEKREKEVNRREKELGFFSSAVKAKKESWYDRVHVSVRTMDWIIWIVSGLLAVVILLIILEAAGIFKI